MNILRMMRKSGESEGCGDVAKSVQGLEELGEGCARGVGRERASYIGHNELHKGVHCDEKLVARAY